MIYCTETTIFMEANTMNPDQTAPMSSLIWIHSVCNISGYHSTSSDKWQMRDVVKKGKSLLHIFNCIETTFIMEANTMSPYQTASKGTVWSGYIVIAIKAAIVYHQISVQMWVVVNGGDICAAYIKLH